MVARVQHRRVQAVGAPSPTARRWPSHVRLRVAAGQDGLLGRAPLICVVAAGQDGRLGRGSCMGCGAPTPAKMAADPTWEKLHQSRPVFSRKGSREGRREVVESLMEASNFYLYDRSRDVADGGLI